jgi:protein O-mannosyl-transferase
MNLKIQPELGYNLKNRLMKVTIINKFANVFTKPASAVILILSSIIIYSPIIFTGFFIWDDNAVALSKEVRNFSFDGIKGLLLNFQVGLYHPVTTFSFMIDFAIGKGNPLVYHCTNILIHTFNSVLLFLFLDDVLKNIKIAFLVSFIFVIHPINIETVAWISSRKDLLSTFFMLLSLLYYSKNCSIKITLKHYLVLMCLISFSVFSKVQTAFIPLLFLLLDYSKGRKLSLSVYLEKLPLFIPVILAGIINLSAQKEYGYLNYGMDYSILEKVFLTFYSTSHYIFNSVIPVSLSVFYPYPFKPNDTFLLNDTILPLIFVVCCILAIKYKVWKNKTILLGILWFLASISIAIGVSWNRDHIIADKYSYFSSIGVYLLLVFGLYQFKNKAVTFRWVLTGGVLCYILFLFLISINRIELWNSPEKLFADASEKFPKSEIILNTLASEEINSGKISEALKHLDRALEISPDYIDALYNKGNANALKGNHTMAIQNFTDAIALNKSYYKSWFGRGCSYMKTGQYSEAISDFTETLKIHYNDFGALQNRAFVNLQVGEFRKALLDLDLALKVDSGMGSTHYLRGLARIMLNEGGCDDLNKAITMGYEPAQKAKDQYCR